MTATITTAPATDALPLATRVLDGDRLQSLADPWNRLAGDVPFRRHEWLATWWRHYQTHGSELFALSLTDGGGALVGLAPFYLTRSRSLGRVVRFLGSGEVASDYVGVLAAKGREGEVAAALAQWLSGAGARHWDLIDLEGVDPDDISTSGLAAELEARGHLTERRERLHSWRVDLPGDFNSFLMGLSKSRRERARQLLRRNFDTGRAALHVVDDIDDVARGLDILRTLHQSRRESLGDEGCFASRQFGDFHAEVARRFFALSRLRLAWLELDGRPAAAEYSLLGGDTVYYYQSGFDAALADARPGWLELVASLKQVIEQGFRQFDFLRGDEAYKASLGAAPRPLVQWCIVARRPAARLRYAVRAAGSRTKAWVKRGLQFPQRRQPGAETGQ